jgi:hypothetical protein
MTRRVIGISVLNVTGVFVIGGAFYDLLVPSVPSNHLTYLGAVDGQIDPRYAELDLAMLRSIGGCLLAIGITALLLTNGPIRRGERWAQMAIVILVGIAEGNNAYRMFRFGSPWYGPFSFAVLTALGALLAGPTIDQRGHLD